MRLVTTVLLSGVVTFDSISVNVNTREEISTLGATVAEYVELCVQQCVSNLMKAVEPTEVGYAGNASEYISHWLSSPATTKPIVPGTITFGGGTIDYSSPHVFTTYSGNSTSPSIAPSSELVVLNNVAQTTSTT